MIEIIKHGLLTSIQDLGRPGYFHLGIPISGAMDRFAMRTANLLVGNSENAAGFEAVFIGPEIKFKKNAFVAVTGADITVKIDDEKQATWTALKVKSGQVLSFGLLKTGARIYIAISGGIDVPIVLGSRSTYLIGSLGGVKGRAIAQGNILSLGENYSKVKEGTTLPKQLRPQMAKQAELRVLTGLYWHRISLPSQKTFFENQWKVALEIDRMGYRFKGGTPLEFVKREPPFGAGSDPSNIVDSCYSYGSIQVPGGLEPIVLHRDAVSAGGYFTLGTVISADMDIIGQLQPNIPTKFTKVTMEQALKARLIQMNSLEKARQYIKQQT
ncbi:MAG: biotin-dependent carboxyltransferase family protein [Tenacibaculum sp.]